MLLRWTSIGSQVHGITLDGQGTATINILDPTMSTLFVRGTDITITGFTITGGSIGIVVARGGVATIINNTIENNTGSGILVTENSSARIGFIFIFDTVASPNVIQNNGSDGIRVQRTSFSRISFLLIHVLTTLFLQTKGLLLEAGTWVNRFDRVSPDIFT